MKSFNKFLTILCTLMVIFSSFCVFANTDDPVVSLSYLSEIFAPNFKSEIKNEIKAELSNKSGNSENTSVEAVSVPKFEVAVIPKGKTFIGEESCEFILRSGNATSVISEQGGLCDTTAGRDIGADEAIPANHLIIIPRNDKRGFVAQEDVIVMVRGEYSIN